MVTLKVQDGETYKKLTGKPVRVPVGAFASGGSVLYYALKDTPQNASSGLGGGVFGVPDATAKTLGGLFFVS
jgi:hypothetical protein